MVVGSKRLGAEAYFFDRWFGGEMGREQEEGRGKGGSRLARRYHNPQQWPIYGGGRVSSSLTHIMASYYDEVDSILMNSKQLRRRIHIYGHGGWLQHKT